MGLNAIFRLVYLMLSIAIVAIAVILYVHWRNTKAELEESTLTFDKLTYQMQKLEQERDGKRDYYQRLLHDDKFADRVIREKLGLAAPDDIVFRFKDSTPVSVDTNIVSIETVSENNKPNADAQEATEDSEEEIQTSKSNNTLLSKLMFWKHSDNDDSNKSQSNDNITEIKIDMAKEEVKPDVIFPSMDKQKQIKTEAVELTESGLIKNPTMTSAPQEPSPVFGSLQDVKNSRTISLKFTPRKSSVLPKTNSNAVKKITFKDLQ